MVNGEVGQVGDRVLLHVAVVNRPDHARAQNHSLLMAVKLARGLTEKKRTVTRTSVQVRYYCLIDRIQTFLVDRM